MEGFSRDAILHLMGEKLAKKMGINRPQLEIDYVEDGDFRISVFEEGELKGLLWVNAETGKIWGFSLEANSPQSFFNDQIKEFVELMKKLI